jgi:hypothetical protein
MRTLKKGDTGVDVEVLTTHLVREKLLPAALHKFTDAVHAAVKIWQVHHTDFRGRPLTVDGVVGPLTWRSLEDAKTKVDRQDPAPTQWDKLPPGGSALGRKALEIGLAEMRAGAREVGTNNGGPFIEKYHKTKEATANQWAWCAAFTSWCFERASKELGQPLPFAYSRGAQAIFDQLQKKGLIYEASDANPPQPGDICVWLRGTTKSWQGHVGIVWGYRDGVVYVLEGNKGNFPAPVRVFEYTLSGMSKLLGFGRVA